MSFCSHCGAQLSENVKFCPNCGTRVISLKLENEPKSSDPFASRPNDHSFEPDSDSSARDAAFETAEKPASYDRPDEQYTPVSTPVKPRSKIVAGILGIIFGGIGLHKFYLGYKKPGLIMLLVSIICSLIGLQFITTIVAIVGLAEGIIYLVKSDEDFYNTYVAGTKEWF